jgi:hypothetical protein
LIARGAVKTEPLTIGAGDDAIRIEARGLSAGQRGAILTDCVVDKAGPDGESTSVTDLAKLGPALVIAGAFDPETREPIFGEADRDVVASLDASFLDPIIAAVGRLSGISAASAASAEKNSDATTVSTSDSRSLES